MSVEFGDIIKIDVDDFDKDDFLKKAKELKPWRKGPFKVGDVLIDSEWQSFMKFNILKPHLDILKDKVVADIGSNNGYYAFKFLPYEPKKVICFDPSHKCHQQFDLINSYIKSDIIYEELKAEDVPNYAYKFDVIFCLGVIYHRSDPVAMLKQLKASLNQNGVVFLDTIFIDGDLPYALVPDTSYAKMSNIYFIPTILALQNWCKKAKFSKFTLIGEKKTDINEQRKTEWIDGYSLENFLKDEDFTIEGYPAPKRVYVKLEV